jgi:hypothetical protein
LKKNKLLFIITAFIIVGVAAFVCLTLSDSKAVTANRKGLDLDLSTLASIAQQYYKRPPAIGGGGNSFTGWILPLKFDTTRFGTYTTMISPQSIKIIGTGFQFNNESRIVHVAAVDSSTVSISISN